MHTRNQNSTSDAGVAMFASESEAIAFARYVSQCGGRTHAPFLDPVLDMYVVQYFHNGDALLEMLDTDEIGTAC